ncbi:MAG: PQQ-binding-like beta-propeller repeat protein [Gemmataceae bacterium]
MNRFLFLLSVCLFGSFSPARAENWPGWRGPTGQGYSAEANPPLKWDAKTNVRWKAPLPDEGNSSPVVWGERVFVVQTKDKGHQRGLICFDRASGKPRWEKYLPYADDEPTHATNPHGSATPVTDGERVIASLGSAGLACWDMDGQQLWHRDFGKQHHIWGNASSPILYSNLGILWVGPGERQTLIAVDKKSGETKWQHDEPGGSFGKDSKDWIGSWSTPVVAKIGDHDELILSVPKEVKGFDPRTGKELWSCDGLTNLVYTSPVVSADGIVVAMSGYGGSAMAVQAAGTGDVTKTHRLWHHTKQNPQRIGSALILDGKAYLMNEPGLASRFDLKTGEDDWNRERLTSPTWSSLVHAAGRLYVTNQAGETLVIKPGDKPEVLAKNPLGERVLASIAISDGDLFIRGYNHLWCIRAK